MAPTLVAPREVARKGSGIRDREGNRKFSEEREIVRKFVVLFRGKVIFELTYPSKIIKLIKKSDLSRYKLESEGPALITDRTKEKTQYIDITFNGSKHFVMKIPPILITMITAIKNFKDRLAGFYGKLKYKLLSLFK